MSVLDRLTFLEERCSGKTACPFRCITKELVDQLHNENEALGMIFGEAYVSKLRDVEAANLLIVRRLNELIEYVGKIYH